MSFPLSRSRISTRRIFPEIVFGSSLTNSKIRGHLYIAVFFITVISLFQFIILPYILINVVIPKNIVFIICIICVVSYFFFAPADTIKRPLPNMKKRKIRKCFTVFIGIIYSILLFIFSDTFIAPLFLSALIVEAIVINPLIYMAFGQPYNNYKTYVQALNI